MTFERNKKIKTNEYGWVLVKLQRLNGVNELRANSYRQQSKKEFTYSNIERNTEKESNKEGSVLSKIGIKNIMKTEQYKSTNNSGIGSSNYEEKWECECGIKNVGKYCVNCGKQKPTKE